MITKLQKEIKSVFKQFPQYWEGETLLKNKAIEDIREYEPNLLAALLKNELIKEAYSVEINDNYIFKNEEFISMLRYKNYLENSYTKYSNQIGLTSEDKYLSYSSDVVLDFPHKDGVLEGGMTQEDLGKEEVFYHNILAKEEIDTLLSPKILTNIKRYNNNGKLKIDKFTDEDNLIIKGNNLIALHSLKKRYQGKIKSIFIDPPYNTGNDTFKYNDRFNQSSWLVFMKNRLEIARELLSSDGSISITIDHNELGHLLLLCDDIFGKENFQNIITVKRASASGAKVINPGVVNVTDYVVIYSREKNAWTPNKVFAPRERDSRYNQFLLNRHEPYTEWKYVTLLDAFSDAKGIQKSQLRKELGMNYKKELDDFAYDNAENIFRFVSLDDGQISKEAKKFKYKSRDNPDEVFFMPREGYSDYYMINGNAMLFMEERLIKADGKLTFGTAITNIWTDVLPNDLHNEGGVSFKKGKKPEKLINRIIELTTNEGDLVLDFFAGSGTTGAVAQKTGRSYILVEQMDYVEDLTVERLKNTVLGNRTNGISNDVNWEGGGSFVYAELYELNQVYINEIQGATNQREFEKVLEKVRKSDFLNLKVDLENVFTENEEFFNLSLSEQKSILIQVLDNNQLYLSYSEIDDDQYEIDEDTKAFNDSFYDEEV